MKNARGTEIGIPPRVRCSKSTSRSFLVTVVVQSNEERTRRGPIRRRFGRDARPIIIITGIHGAQLGRAKDRRRTVACIALLSSFIPLDFHPCVPCIDYKYHDRVITHMCNYTGSSRYYIIFGFVTFRFNRLESRLHAFLLRTIVLSLRERQIPVSSVEFKYRVCVPQDPFAAVLS